MPGCVYRISISITQKVILGFLGTSLVINFGVFIWWLRLYCYKRTMRKRDKKVEFDEDSDDSNTDMEMYRQSTENEFEQDSSMKYGSYGQAISGPLDTEMSRRYLYNSGCPEIRGGMEGKVVDLVTRKARERINYASQRDESERRKG